MILRLFLLILIVLPLSSCLVGDTKCCDYVSTNAIAKGLYIERYRTFCAGVFGELTECYITDSINFRYKIGSYDEHEFFQAILNGDSIKAYNLQSASISDTIEEKTITKDNLLKYHHTDTNCLSTSPLFGKNTIKCDTDFYPASAYKTADQNYMAEVQYKCGNDYSNAVFYTDSLHFCIFLGVYVPGSLENNYSVHRDNDKFVFYNITDRRRLDTVKTQTYLLNNLKKEKLITVCKNTNKQK